MSHESRRLVAFSGVRRLALGPAEAVARACRRQARMDAATDPASWTAARIAVYDARDGRAVDLDLGGSDADVVARLAAHPLIGVRAAGRAARPVEAAYRFMHDIGGDFAGFEDASRALFANDPVSLAAALADWPSDVREQIARYLAGNAAGAGPDGGAS